MPVSISQPYAVEWNDEKFTTLDIYMRTCREQGNDTAQYEKDHPQQ
jgi:hypothetical protein